MPDYLAAEGVRFRLEPGWSTRARSSGGFDNVMGVQWHHTASRTTPSNDISYMWYNASTKPIGNVLLDRAGLVHVGAAGAANTAGRGGPRISSRGTIPLDNGNRNLIAIEAANDGLGENWPTVQCDAYIKLSVALLKGASRETPGVPLSARDIHSHFEWAPTRKTDPRGPARTSNGVVFATGGTQLWNMAAARTEVQRVLTPPPPPPPPPGQDPGVLRPHGWYYLNAGESPWSVAAKIWGSGALHPALTARNPGNWFPGRLIEIPDLPTIVLTVAQGESPWSILERLFPDDEPQERMAAFYAFNGGQNRVLKPGDVISVPVHWQPRS